MATKADLGTDVRVEGALSCMMHVADEGYCCEVEIQQRQILGTDMSRGCVVLHDTYTHVADQGQRIGVALR